MKFCVFLAFAVTGTNAFADINCVYPNNDTNEWGWNARDLSSCPPIVESTPVISNGVTACLNPGLSDLEGDGWGWENGASCQVMAGGVVTPLSEPVVTVTSPLNQLITANEWNCTKRNALVIDSVVRNVEQNYNYISGFHGVSDWSTQQPYQVFGNCSGKCSTDGGLAALDMKFSGSTVSISTTDFGGNWQGNKTHDWSLDGFTVTIKNFSLNTDIIFQQIGFENYNGKAYMHLYTNNSNRYTCAAI